MAGHNHSTSIDRAKGTKDIKMSKMDKLYIELGFWKCKDSPSGAHHWIELLENKGMFKCQWYEEHRRFIKNWNELINEEEPRRMARLILTDVGRYKFDSKLEEANAKGKN